MKHPPHRAPGTGKSMIAKHFPTILPPLPLEEALETTKIHSIIGLLLEGQALVTRWPFCPLHHTVSDARFLGGSNPSTPGNRQMEDGCALAIDRLNQLEERFSRSAESRRCDRADLMQVQTGARLYG